MLTRLLIGEPARRTVRRGKVRLLATVVAPGSAQRRKKAGDAAVGSRRAIGRSRTNFLQVKCFPLATRRDRLPFYRLRCPRIFQCCGPTFASSAHNRGTPGGEWGRELLSRGARSGLRAGSIREFARSLARTRPQQSEIRLSIPAGVNPVAVQCTTRAT
jgi:hypothetical protein